MDYVSLGKSNLLVSRTAFGAMALDSIKDEEVVDEKTQEKRIVLAKDIVKNLIKQAYDDGVNFFDTSNATPESERLLGEAINSLGIRENVIIATKSSSQSSKEIASDLENSLCNLNVDYIDLYQLENLSILPEALGIDGIVNELITLKSSGKIRHFGIATEDTEIALQVLKSDVEWESIQFPFNMLCPKEIETLVDKFFASDIGFIAMRPLCGGLVNNIPLALGYLRQFDNVVPVWGVRNSEELQQILYFNQNPPNIDEKFLEEINHQKEFFN